MKKYLVTYASRSGSTEEIAQEIASTLMTRGFAVDLAPMKSNPVLAGYDGVILGSSIRRGGWLPEALAFVHKNQATLDRLPTQLFTVHMINTGSDEESLAARLAYTAPVRLLLATSPQEEMFFAGCMDTSRLSLFERLFTRSMELKTGSLAGDQRDWQKIRSWAKTILN